MKKSLLTLTLACILMLVCVVPALADVNLEGYPITDETIFLKLVIAEANTANTHTDMWALVRLQKETGVRLEVERVDNSVWNERKSLMFASNELPDLIIGSFTTDERSLYFTSGQLTSMNDMLPLMPNYSEFLKRFQPIERAKLYDAQGNMIGFIGQASEGKKALPGARVVINQKWLDAVEMKMPTNWDELVAVLTAFRDKDPNGNGENDEIPLSGAISTAAQVFVTETLGISNNSAGTRSDWYEGEDGSMEYLMTSDLYKTYLERMHYLYAEKLLDNEIYTQSSTQFLAKGANMQIGACRTDAPFVLAGTDPEKYEQYVAFGPIAPEGGEPRQYFNEMYGANLYVTKANQYREVTARLLDYLYTEEWAQIIRGPQLGSEAKGDWDGKGGWYYIDDTQTKYAFEVPEEYSGVYYWRIGAVAPMALRGGLGYSETWMNEVMSDTDTHLRAIYADTWQYTVPCFPQEYSLTQEEADELALISTELKTYVDQMEVKFVVGEVDIDEGWDEFQAHLKSIGVEDYIRINQGAYERYLEIANNLE